MLKANPDAPQLRVDVIVTPDEVIEVPARRRKRSPRILWDHLDADKRDAIPVLSATAIEVAVPPGTKP